MLFRSRRIGFWIWFFWIALFPTNNLIIPIGSVGAYRFLYLPSLAWGVLMAHGLVWLLERGIWPLSAEARRRAEDEFSWQKVTRKLLEIYTDRKLS